MLHRKAMPRLFRYGLRIVVLEHRIARDAWSFPCRDPTAFIVCFEAVCKSLPATAWQVDHEIRSHEAGNGASYVLLEVEDGRERSPHVFNTTHHVGLVHVVRLNVQVGQLVNECRHDTELVVDSFEQHALVTDRDAALEEETSGELGDICDLVWVIEVLPLVSKRSSKSDVSWYSLCAWRPACP